MRWKNSCRDDTKWHKWFAWFPVFIEGHTVWLETIERRVSYSTYDDWWEYRNVVETD